MKNILRVNQVDTNSEVDFVLIYPPASLNPFTPARVIPIGGLYLADALSDNGYATAIIDDGVENIKSRIMGTSGDKTIAFGISSLSGAQLKNALSVAKFIRDNYPDKPIIWGGAHATALPSQTLESKFVDFIVWGEGEISLPQLLDSIKNKNDFSRINGIGYKEKVRNYCTHNIGYTNLDRVFKLPYHLLNMEMYVRKMNIGLKRCFPIMSSRGCPFKCKFCSNSSSIWPNTKMRYHTLDNIIWDIETLVNEYNADGITFVDENFFVDEKRLICICKVLMKKNFNVKYRTAVRADLLSRLSIDTWHLLRETGFIGMGVGIESGSQRVLDFIGKGITLEQIYKIDHLLTKYKFFKSYSFMTCIPGETIDDVKKTLSLILFFADTSKYCPYPFGTLHKFIPLPGTDLFNVVVEDGFKPPQCISGWTSFDFENVSDTISTVRPWMKKDLLAYVSRAIILIEKLNNLYVGDGLDNLQVDSVIREIKLLIDSD